MDQYIKAPVSQEDINNLHAGDYVYITGTIYTARDAAHKRMYESLQKGEKLPIELEGNLIYPRVVGSSIGIPGLWVLAAVTIGGGLYGILGMLVGVPLTATIYRLIKEDIKRREKKQGD